MTTPDHTLAARLDVLARKSIRQKITGQTGAVNYAFAVIEAYSTNQLITTAEADARVKAAVLAEREAAKSMVWTLGHEIKASMLVDEDNEQAVLDMVRATAAAIRSRGVTG